MGGPCVAEEGVNLPAGQGVQWEGCGGGGKREKEARMVGPDRVIE